jgi:hypothetical protein
VTFETVVVSSDCFAFFRISFQVRNSFNRFNRGPSCLVVKSKSSGEMLLEPRR